MRSVSASLGKATAVLLTGAATAAYLLAASKWHADRAQLCGAMDALSTFLGLSVAALLLLLWTQLDERRHYAWAAACITALSALALTRTWTAAWAPAFDPSSAWILALGGAGFWAAAAWFARRPRLHDERVDAVLAWFCFLLGPLVIASSWSARGQAVWWFCQFLHTAACAFVFAHLAGVYRETNAAIRSRLESGRLAEERLREAVSAAAQSERELCQAIGDLQCSEAALLERVAELGEARDSALRMMQSADEARSKAERAQESLQAEERRLRSILDSIQAGILVIDAESRLIVEANPAALRMIGATKAEVIGRDAHDLISPTEPPDTQVTHCGAAGSQTEQLLQRLDGQSLPVLRTVIPALLDGRRHLLDSFVDISDRKRAELALLRSNEICTAQARALATLLEFSQSLLAVKTLDEVLERTVAVAAELTSSHRVSIMLPDEANRCLTIAKSMGIEPQVAAAVRIPVGGFIAGRVFQTGEAIVLNRPEEVEPHGVPYDTQFFASTPLVSKALSLAGQIVGVLNITERTGGRPFEAAELEYIDLIRNVAATVVNEINTRQARDQARDSIVVALAKLADYRDTDTGRHLDRVTKYAVTLAEELQTHDRFCQVVDEQFVRDLEKAMPLHDIGKVAIPDRILLKPGKLTRDEIAVMMTHAEIGAKTLRSVIERVAGVSFLYMAEEIAWGHHERYDGGGYPRRIAGEAIPASARIAAVADVYDALTSKRVYKPAMPHETAAAIIQEGSGSQFDPAVVEAFLRREDEFRRLAAENADEASLAEPFEEVFVLQ